MNHFLNQLIQSDDARKKDRKKLLPYFTQSGEDREENGDQYLANLKDGSWCGFRYFNFDGTEKSLAVTVRGDAAGTLKAYTDRSLPLGACVPVGPAGQPRGSFFVYSRSVRARRDTPAERSGRLRRMREHSAAGGGLVRSELCRKSI